MDIFKLEYRAVIKFLTKEGINPKIIKERMDKVYGEVSPSKSSVCYWAKLFREGRQSIEDDPRTGRPILSMEEESLGKNEFVNCQEVEKMNDENVDINQTEDSYSKQYAKICKTEVIGDPLEQSKITLKVLENGVEHKERNTKIENIKTEKISDDETERICLANKITIKQQSKSTIQNVEEESNRLQEDKVNQEEFHPLFKKRKSNNGVNNLNKCYCKNCCKYFATPYTLKTHIRAIHRNEGQICPECGVHVRANCSLKDHMEIHRKDLRYRCKLCKKAFKHRRALKRHMDTHSSDKYICSICGIKLSTSNGLIRHRFVHNDVKQHKCPCCSQSFNRTEALRNHLILHTGLKPHVCIFCDRTFAHVSNCRAHLKKSHAKLFADYDAAGKSTIRSNNVPTLDDLLQYIQKSDTIYSVKTKSNNKTSEIIA